MHITLNLLFFDQSIRVCCDILLNQKSRLNKLNDLN